MFHMLRLCRMSDMCCQAFHGPLTALRNNYVAAGSKYAKRLTKLWLRTIVIKPLVYKAPI